MTWFLIFERTTRERAHGANFVIGAAAGSGETRPAQYRGFKPLLIVEVDDGDGWKQALEAAVKLTGRLGEYAAVACDVFTPDLLKVPDEPT